MLIMSFPQISGYYITCFNSLPVNKPTSQMSCNLDLSILLSQANAGISFRTEKGNMWNHLKQGTKMRFSLKQLQRKTQPQFVSTLVASLRHDSGLEHFNFPDNRSGHAFSWYWQQIHRSTFWKIVLTWDMEVVDTIQKFPICSLTMVSQTLWQC